MLLPGPPQVSPADPLLFVGPSIDSVLAGLIGGLNGFKASLIKWRSAFPPMAVDRIQRYAAHGLLATVVMSVPMSLGSATGASPMPQLVPEAIFDTIVGGPVGFAVALGAIGHFTYGALAAGAWTHFRTPSPREGFILCLALWVLMGLVFLPLVGWGLFGLSITPRIAIATLVLHLFYGGTLALLWRNGDAPAAGVSPS